jgi:predicted phage terminase large subunit-like protein
LIEDTGVGTALAAELKKAGLPARAVKPQHDKKIRMLIQSRKFEDGTVLLPTQAVWLADLEPELFGFPHTRYDDQVDCLSQGLAYERATDFDFGKFADGMGKLYSGLAFQQNFGGRIL